LIIKEGLLPRGKKEKIFQKTFGDKGKVSTFAVPIHAHR
jgi:hypothetical protein